MLNKKFISFAAFEPRSNLEYHLFKISFPENWKEGLKEFYSPDKFYSRENVNFPTKSLGPLIMGWQDNVIRMNPVSITEATPDWLVSLRDFTEEELKKLFRIVEIWIRSDLRSRKGINIEKLNQFISSISWLDLKSNTGKYEPTSRPDLSAVCLHAVNTLKGKTITLGADKIPLVLCCSGKDSMITSPICHEWKNKKYYWSIGIKFKPYLLSPGGKSVIYCNVMTQRWIAEAWKTKNFSISHKINAYIAITSTLYCRIPIERGEKWATSYRECFNNKYSFCSLPDPGKLLKDPLGFPKILLPYAIGMKGFEEPLVGTGISVLDTSELMPQLLSHLDKLIQPELPTAQNIRINHAHFPNIAPSMEIKKETGESICNLQEQAKFIGHIKNIIGKQIISFDIYSEDTIENNEIAGEIEKELRLMMGNHVKLKIHDIGKMSSPLAKDESLRHRASGIALALGHSPSSDGAFVIIPPAESYSQKKLDPKTAIRNGFANKGIKTQFINEVSPASSAKTKQNEDNSLSAKIRKSIFDLLRQNGVVAMPYSLPTKQGKNWFKPVVCIAIHIISLQRKRKKTLRLPVMVKYDPFQGTAYVKSEIFPNKRWLPYGEACLLMAALIPGKLENNDYNPALFINELAAEFMNPDAGVLLTAEVPIRALSNQNAEFPNKALFSRKVINRLCGTGVRYIMVNKDCPDYFCEKNRNGKNRLERSSGLFIHDDAYFSIGDSAHLGQSFDLGYKISKLDKPNENFRHRRLLAFYPMQMQKNDVTEQWVGYLDDLRKAAIQNAEISLSLPLPLHLAKGLEEYLFQDNAEDDDDEVFDLPEI